MGEYKKLDYKYYGPYETLRGLGEKSYELALPTHLHVHNVFHVSLLKNYVANLDHVLNVNESCFKECLWNFSRSVYGQSMCAF